MIKSRHVAFLEERMDLYKILVWKSIEVAPLKTVIMLKYVLEKLVVKMIAG
jgi:hypothetical protein